MKKTCKDAGSDGKGKGQARTRKAVTDLLKACFDAGDVEAMDYARSLCGNECEAEELVQEACYRVLRAGSRYDSGRPFKGWLIRILRNAFLDSRKRKDRRDGLSLDWAADDNSLSFGEKLPDGTPDHLEGLERADVSERVRAALKKLPRIHRRVLQLCDMERMSYEEAAAKLGVPLGTVRSRLARARKSMAAKLGKSDWS